MAQYATTYLRQCSCSLPDQLVEFTVDDHKTFIEMMNSGRTVIESYTEVLSKFYPIDSIQDIRVCCQNSLFTGRGQASAFPQDIGSPEDLIRSTNYNPIAEVMTVESVDDVGEGEPFLDIHATVNLEGDTEVSKSRIEGTNISGFRIDGEGKHLKVQVGMGLEVRILDTDGDKFRSG